MAEGWGSGYSLETEVAGKAVLVRELLGVRAREHHVTLDGGPDDLAVDIAVGKAHDKPVLGGVELVLGLGDKPLAGAVVGLAFAPPAVLGLVPLEVRSVLHKLHERHDLLSMWRMVRPAGAVFVVIGVMGSSC
eukprot:502127-Rhodomonas_salina.1